MPQLSLEPLTDEAALAALYADPYIARVGNDLRPAAPIHHPAACYLAAKEGDEIVGAFLIIQTSPIELDLHALLTERAMPHCREFGRMCISVAFLNDGVQRVTAYVIDGLKTVRNYCRKLGFSQEGFRRNAIQKGGELRGIYMMGMTRQEWGAQWAL